MFFEIYKKDTDGERLEFLSHPEGYTELSGTDFNYVFQYKDHLEGGA